MKPRREFRRTMSAGAPRLNRQRPGVSGCSPRATTHKVETSCAGQVMVAPGVPAPVEAGMEVAGRLEPQGAWRRPTARSGGRIWS